ncbi:MAG: BatD family protein [Prevotella sp.]|nr:BatD family protein [Prevotella sp.]
MPVIALAQKITVQGPTRVAVGEQFQLRYVVNTTDVKNFRIGNVPDAFEVLMGPSTSTQQSFSFVNGHTSQQSSVTYTYVLMANKNGTYIIPSAKATVAGNNAVSSAIKITVSGQAQQGGGQHQQQSRRVDRAGARISGNDLFLRVTANKQKVYEQEPILLTYKVYTRVELTALEGKMPDLKGFHTQEIPLPQQKTFHQESVNGRVYNCVTWSQYVMFPQMSGKLTIPSLTFNGIVMQQNPNVDPFEAFFNGGSGYIEVKKSISAPSVDIEVLPLPAKPADFSGGVGHFSITSSLDKKEVKAGEPVNVRFVVSGVGNMKLLKQPELAVPKDFEKYDAKITDKTKLTTDGVTGSMIYDILIVPRNKGSYTLPATKFVYFDTQTHQYKTLTTQPLKIEVEQGSGNGNVNVNYNDNDIHDLMLGENQKQNISDTFFGTSTHLSIIAGIVAAFIALCVVFRKRAMAISDVVVMRGKKANKVAMKRLRKAHKLMMKNEPADFYDEVLRALWNYVSDKLTMPVEQLSKENITEKMQQKDIQQDTITSFIEAIDECEYARYAPGDRMGNMQKTYGKAVETITKIADRIGIILLIIIFNFQFSIINLAHAQTKPHADAAYRAGEYQKAVQLYEKSLKEGISAETYYNMGNAYYRMAEYPQAMVSYLHAQKLKPSDKDIQHNIDITINKTIDRIPVDTDVLFVQWYKSLVFSATVNTWTWISIISLALALLIFLAYLFMDSIVVRKAAFYLSMLLVAIFLFSMLFAFQQERFLHSCDQGVVISEMATVKSSPTKKASDSFVIHEGTAVQITDDDISQWLGIKLSDGRQGWIPTSTIEIISK